MCTLPVDVVSCHVLVVSVLCYRTQCSYHFDADIIWFAYLQILAVKESKVDPQSSILNVYKATSDGLTITKMYDSITLGTDATPSSGVAPGGSYAGKFSKLLSDDAVFLR